MWLHILYAVSLDKCLFARPVKFLNTKDALPFDCSKQAD